MINNLPTAIEELEILLQTGSDFENAINQAIQMLAEKELTNEPMLHCRLLLALTESLWRRGLCQQALLYAEQALSLTHSINDRNLEAKALGYIGIIYTYLSDFSRALVYMDKAMLLNQELHNKPAIAGMQINIGNIYQKLGDYSIALENYSKAVTVFEGLGNQVDTARAMGSIGMVYMRIGDYAHALESCGKALTAFEELGDKSGAAGIIGNIGTVYEQLSDFPRALEYYSKALAAFEELENKRGVAIFIGNIGSVYMYLRDYSNALEYFGKAITAYEELNNKAGITHIISCIGNIYLELNDYPIALEYHGKALAAFEELGMKQEVASTKSQIGFIYLQQDFKGNDGVKAEEYLLNALAILEELGAKREQYDIHKLLADMYQEQKRWEESNTHFRKYHQLKEEVQSDEARKQADKIDFQRKNAEREKQIAVERATIQARIEEQQKLIHNVLPPSIAERLLQNETFIADNYSGISVLFMDLVNFTQLSQHIPPRQLIYLLNTIFSRADKVMEKFGLEKIKTIGDAYMAVAGAPIVQPDHAYRAAHAALGLLEEMNNLSIIIPDELGSANWAKDLSEINVRIGLHCGEAIGGVIGDKKFSFDLWGDAVNTASRMESHGEAGRIHVSEEFAEKLTGNLRQNLTLRQAQYTAQTLSQGEGFSFPFGESRDGVSFTLPLGEGRDGVSFTFPLGEGRDGVLIPRGEIEIKGKGRMKTYFLERI
jgi:class 3 adenylate cyclase/Tfp pilus assembly protein PilF